MRSFKTALLATASFLAASSGLTASGALAADLAATPLRGAFFEPPAPASTFEGFYLGGHGGWGSTDFKLSQQSKKDVQDILNYTSLAGFNPQNNVLIPDRDARSSVYGAFVGYNVRFDDVIVGVEGDYSRSDFNVNSTYSSLYYRVNSTPFNYDYHIDATAKAQITDLGTFRVRAGYVVGDVMAFVTGGAALGHGMYGNTTTYLQANCNSVANASCVPTNYFATNRGKTKTDAFYGGYTLGAGLEANLVANLFVRGEYQWVRLQGAGADANINIARGGLGARF